MLGITGDKWLALLRQNRIDPLYWHRAAVITLASLVNSVYRRREEQAFGSAVRATRVEAPVFIIGHWRSGTTLLATLLALDEGLVVPNSYQVANPYTFLSTEDWLTRPLAPLMPTRRPMDNMPLGFDTPQEEEFALALMTLHSPYLGMSFPGRQDHYLQYLGFDDVPPAVIAVWKEAYLTFLGKLAFKYSDRTLLLKSSCTTARIKLILELFPRARFIHLVRHPFQVFQSTRHLYDTMAWYLYLQRPPAEPDEFILRQYRAMYDSFFAQRTLIPAGQYCELRYERLAQAPYPTVAHLYEQLRLGDFKGLAGRLKRHLERIRDYRANTHSDLPPTLRHKVSKIWERNFLEWNYSAG